jgi:phosphoribosyl 1,2-cyclic phosphate phosphodiesterase
LKVLIDCGPDITDQLMANHLDRPDVVLITHEHGDHYLGLDDLEVFRRREPAKGFVPIPVYATETAWRTIEARFGYLLGKLLEKRLVQPGLALDGLPRDLRVIPFKTDHGPVAGGSVGYVFEYPGNDGPRRLVYTSDFKDVVQDPKEFGPPDLLVASCHWLNEPVTNPAFHMSLQRLLPFIRAWGVRERVYLVHLSAGDPHPGEGGGAILKKRDPLDPLRDGDGRLLAIPRDQEEWQQAAEKVFRLAGLDVPVTVAHDGLATRVG